MLSRWLQSFFSQRISLHDLTVDMLDRIGRTRSDAPQMDIYRVRLNLCLEINSYCIQSVPEISE